VITLPVPTDDELVTRAVAGDRGAEELLYRRHAGYVGGLAARLMGSTIDGEDVLQESFFVAFDRLGDLRDRQAFRAWVARIAVSRVQRRLRTRRLFRLFGAEADAGLFDLASHDASGEVRAELALIEAALREVPGDERLARSLHHVEGHTLEEAATMLGCSLATVKRRIAGAQRCVERHRGIGEHGGRE
jgi:RNA polymerase sigma-70 factor (ECF subfamily)